MECPLPKDSEIIQLLVPRFEEFRSRWFQHANGWIGGHTLIFSAGTGAITKPLGTRKDENISFMAAYRFYVDYKEPLKPVVEKIEYAGDNF